MKTVLPFLNQYKQKGITSGMFPPTYIFHPDNLKPLLTSKQTNKKKQLIKP